MSVARLAALATSASSSARSRKRIAALYVLDVVQVALAGFVHGHSFLGGDDTHLGHLASQRHLRLLSGEPLAAAGLADRTELAFDVAAADPPAPVPGAAMDDHRSR